MSYNHDHDEAARREREAQLDACEKVLGHWFVDRSLLDLALTHSSLKDPWTESNERLEFLGDSVIGLAVSEHLFCTLADLPEGELTRIKSIVVSRSALAKVGKELGLKDFLRVGKGIRKRRAIPPSLVANAVEAVIGAVYLDAGFEVARDLVIAYIDALLANVSRRKDTHNHKAALQHAAQKGFGTTPRYRVMQTDGPDHKREFMIEAIVGERAFPPGRGTTKKQAEQRAARQAMRVLKQEYGADLAGA